MHNKKTGGLLRVLPIIFAVLLLAGGIGYVVTAFASPAKAVMREPEQDTAEAQTPSAESMNAAEMPQGSKSSSVSETWGRHVTYKGVSYTKKDNLKTILFLGVDNGKSKTQLIGQGGRADSICLFILNPETKTIHMLSVSRDTIVGVDVYDTKGYKLYTGKMQITMQYAYGSSASKSCKLMERRVGELIHGIDIDGYFSLTMDGLPAIIDGIGGLKLTIPEDFSYIDKAYTKGAVVTMNGREAEHFIRYRDCKTPGSNNVRMARDAWLIGELFHQLCTGKFSVSQLLDLADAYIETDLDADTMKNLTSYTLSDLSYTMPGMNKEGKNHDEFYVDDETLIPILLDLYYKKK